MKISMPTHDQLNQMIKNAKSREDGVYVKGSFHYAVKNKRILFFTNYEGIIHQACYSFLVQIGKTENHYKDTKIKALKKLLKEAQDEQG